jgi:hypothetical protein
MKTKPFKKLSWGALAERLGVSRRSLGNWRKLPGAPGTCQLAPWRKFVEENSLGIAPNKITPDRARLMEENLVKRNRLLGLEIAKQEGKLVRTADVDQMLLRIASLQKIVLYQKLEREMPVRTDGKDTGEKLLIGRSIADELCEIFSQEADRWAAAVKVQGLSPD